MADAIFPWQTGIWRQLLGAREQLPHALLLYGRRGIGKLSFARALAQALLCEAPLESGHACGKCLACGWYAEGNHPDFRMLEPEADALAEETQEKEGERTKGKKPSKFITIDQVRELAGVVNLTTHRHGFRVILIHPAEAMNLNAANALLKTLEEPSAKTVFILVSHQLQRLLPTVRSRCRKIAMPAPARETALNWLQAQDVADPELCLAQAGHAPLYALSLCAGDCQAQRREFLTQLAAPQTCEPISLAERSEKLDLSLVIGWLQQWVHDLIGCRLAGDIRYQPDFADNLRELSAQAGLPQLIAFQRELLEVRQMLHQPLNAQLLLEQVLLSYTRSVAGKKVERHVRH